jgi:hypothetical protein
MHPVPFAAAGFVGARGPPGLKSKLQSNGPIVRARTCSPPDRAASVPSGGGQPQPPPQENAAMLLLNLTNSRQGETSCESRSAAGRSTPPFTVDEDEVLRRARHELQRSGHSNDQMGLPEWAAIARQLPGRDPTSVQTRWDVLFDKRHLNAAAVGEGAAHQPTSRRYTENTVGISTHDRLDKPRGKIATEHIRRRLGDIQAHQVHAQVPLQHKRFHSAVAVEDGEASSELAHFSRSGDPTLSNMSGERSESHTSKRSRGGGDNSVSSETEYRRQFMLHSSMSESHSPAGFRSPQEAYQSMPNLQTGPTSIPPSMMDKGPMSSMGQQSGDPYHRPQSCQATMTSSGEVPRDTLSVPHAVGSSGGVPAYMHPYEAHHSTSHAPSGHTQGTYMPHGMHPSQMQDASMYTRQWYPPTAGWQQQQPPVQPQSYSPQYGMTYAHMHQQQYGCL